MTKDQIAQCFNEWMRRYTESPQQFDAEFQMVGQFITNQAEGREPTYGQVSAAYLERLGEELGIV